MLQVSLLGEQVIVDDHEGDVVTRSLRTLELIAFLAAHVGVPQRRARIATALWPDTDETQALTNLRRELHHLRRLLPPDGGLVVTPVDLSWRTGHGCDVDLVDFRRHAAAALAATSPAAALQHGAASLAAYRGELLPGVLDEWALELRAELTGECVAVCDAISAAAVAVGDPVAGLDAARRRVRLAPLEECGHRTLIGLLLAAGDRAGALSAYHQCAAALREELGVEPDAETRALVAHLRSVRARTTPEPRPVPLLGRETELRQLLTDFAQARRARLVLLAGPPGVGKSRLVGDVVRRVRAAGYPAAIGRSYAMRGQLPLAPVGEWFAALDGVHTGSVHTGGVGTDGTRGTGGGAVGDDGRTGGTGPRRGRTGGRAVPGPTHTVRGVGAGEPDAAMRDAWQRFRLFRELVATLQRQGRVLLVLEDLHWCDSETLDFLTYLLTAAHDAPILLVATCRPLDLDAEPGLVQWVASRQRAGDLARIDLPPLTPEHTAQLVAHLRGHPVDADQAHRLHATTGGFPLHVLEAARIDTGHEQDLAGVLRARIDALSPPARYVAGLAAALGRDFTVPQLRAAADLPDAEVAHAVDELWSLGIVHRVGAGYDFAHDLLRTAAYHGIPPASRGLLHERLGRALTDHADPPLLARQFSRAGRPERAAEHYLASADAAAAVYAYTDAARYLRAALDELAATPAGRDRDVAELTAQRRLCACLNAVHGWTAPELHTALRRTIALAEALQDRSALVDALVSLWGAEFVRGDNRRADHTADRVLDLTGAEGVGRFVAGGTALHRGRPQASVTHFEAAIAAAGDGEVLAIGSRPAVHGRAWLAHAYWFVGEPARAAQVAAEAVTRARTADHAYNLAIALGYAAITEQLLGRRDRVATTTDELAALCARYGLGYYREWATILGGWARGGTAGAAEIRAGIRRLRTTGAHARMTYWLALLADVLPDPAEARAVLDGAATAARATEDLWWLPEIERRRALLGPPDRARQGLAAALALATAQGSVALAERCRAER